MQLAVWPFAKGRSPPPPPPRQNKIYIKNTAHKRKMAARFILTPSFLLRTGERCLWSRITASLSLFTGSVPVHGLYPHQDNVGARTAAAAVDFLNEGRVQLLLPHPPCSQDLSPCHFFQFTEVKKQVKGTLFESAEEAYL